MLGRDEEEAVSNLQQDGQSKNTGEVDITLLRFPQQSTTNWGT